MILLLADVTQAADEKAALTLFQHHCIKCHGKGGQVKGKVNLLEIGTVADLTSNPELLQTIIAVLDTGKMPPGKEAVLKPNARTTVVKVLRGLLAVSTANAFASTPVRRMNRLPYNNAVQEFFGLKVVVFALPERTIREGEVYFRPDSGKMPEQVRVGCRPLGKSQMIESRIVGVGPFPQDLRAENGFDNRGDHLSLSPLLMETFLKLSCGIVESPTFNPNTVWGMASYVCTAGGRIRLGKRSWLAIAQPLDKGISAAGGREVSTKIFSSCAKPNQGWKIFHCQHERGGFGGLGFTALTLSLRQA